MKNALRVIAIVVVAALLFGIGYSLGSKSGITVNLKVESAETGAKTNTDVPANTTPATEPAAPATEPAAPATEPADKPADSDKKEEKKEEKKDSKGVPSSTAEIIAAYNKAITDVKAVKNVSINKKEAIDIHVTDCSISAATKLIDPIVQKFITDTDDTLDFVNDDCNGRNIDSFIPPTNRACALTDAAVLNASANAEGDGYVMTIKLNAEKSTYDGTNTVNPEFNNSVVDPLNLATIEISPAKITNADMSYPGTELVATIDGSGKLAKLVVTLPMEGTGTGSISVFNISVGLAGQLVDTYTLTY